MRSTGILVAADELDRIVSSWSRPHTQNLVRPVALPGNGAIQLEWLRDSLIDGFCDA